MVTGLGYEFPSSLRSWFEAGISAELQGTSPLTHDADPVPFLRVKKTAKFMSKQDRLAMSAAARAVSSSGLSADVLETQTLIAMGVGPIPFQESEALAVAERSRQDGSFSAECFCRDAYEEVNPMLLFACLPNMPTYHISANLNIRGGYYLTYPSCTESYQALQNAVDSLTEGRAMAVLFGGVADQQNFLVRNHHHKTHQKLPAPDCACFLVLETLQQAQVRKATVLARLDTLQCGPDSDGISFNRTFCLGPVDIPLEVARFIEGGAGHLRHSLSENGISFESRWGK